MLVIADKAENHYFLALCFSVYVHTFVRFSNFWINSEIF